MIQSGLQVASASLRRHGVSSSLMQCCIFTACIARMYGFCLVGVSVCPSVCLSVRAQKVHLKGSKLLILTWKLELGMLGMRSNHVGDHPMVPVCLTGQEDTFWDRLGCLSGAFCPFNGLRSSPNHFQMLHGHADKKAYPYLLNLSGIFFVLVITR